MIVSTESMSLYQLVCAMLALAIWCPAQTRVASMVVPVELPTVLVETNTLPFLSLLPLSWVGDGNTLLLATATPKDSAVASFSTRGFQKDQVVRVLDANTLKLLKTGVVTLAGVRVPTPGSSNFQLPDCMPYAPAYKLRKLMPANSKVLVQVGASISGKSTQAVIVRAEDSLLVNQELIRTGFGRFQKLTSNNLSMFLDADTLQILQANAKEQGMGIFKRCDQVETVPEAQFEPLEFTVETQWGDDGGKSVIRSKETESGTPNNPGDIRGCSDFSTYEDALRWYERFVPYYGDVAKLDRDGDGVPCPGLPHTKVADKYRMKVPTTFKR